MNLPFFISRKLKSDKTVTFSSRIQRIAVVSIALCIFSLIVAFTVLEGFQNKISEKIFSFSGHLIITKYTLSSSFEESIQIDPRLIADLNDSEFVKHWQRVAYKAGLLNTNNEVQGVLLKGIDESFDFDYFRENMVEGDFPDFLSGDYSTDVVISRMIANTLRLSVGDKLIMFFIQDPPRFRNLTISGIYETDMTEFDERIILGDLDMIRRLNDWDSTTVAAVEVFIEDDGQIPKAQEELFTKLDANLYVQSAIDNNIQLFDWLGLLNRNVLIFLILILVVACFCMISILLILIMERTPMIGILKSMGAADGLIRRIFLTNGLDLIVRGLGWGNFLGLLFAFIQLEYRIIPLDPVNYYVSYIPIYLNWPIILGLNFLVVVLITLSLQIPIRIISRIQPIRAIRFD